MNFNKIMLAGNLTRDPEVRFLANEQAVANFNLAANRKFKGNDGQMKEEVTYVDCEAWGKTAELIGQYLTKGRACFVEGRLKLETWKDKTDGSNRSKLKVVIENVQFIGHKPDADRQADAAKADTEVLPSVTTREVVRPAHPANDEPPF